MALDDEKKHKILKIKENKFYFTLNNYVHISNTNFPQSHFGFASGRPRYWKIKVNNFNIENSTLEVEILDYNSNEIETFNLQEKRYKLGSFKFEKIIWSKLKPCLTKYSEDSYKQISNAFINISDKIEDPDDSIDEKIIGSNLERYPGNNPAFERQKRFNNKSLVRNEQRESEELNKLPDEPIKQEITIKFSEYYKNALFKDGYILIETHINMLSSVVEIKIENQHIIENFEYIKHYFRKITGSKKFNVSATLTFLDDELKHITATSKEIEAINENTIEQVKDAIAIEIIKIKSSDEEDTSIYTADEVLSKSNESQNIFNQTENEIIDRITNLKSVRNKKQLLFLSGNQLKEAKIRFTLDKNFGYLFLMKSGKSKIVSWELLKSNATYVWSFNEDDSNESIFERMQTIIKTIQINGRKKYRAAVKRNEIDEGLNFKLIYHTKSKNKNVDNFVTWKKKLENYLVNS